MGQVDTIHMLNKIENSQLIRLGKDISVGKFSDRPCVMFNVHDSLLTQHVAEFIFHHDDRHKKILLGKFDYRTNCIQISYIST